VAPLFYEHAGAARQTTTAQILEPLKSSESALRGVSQDGKHIAIVMPFIAQQGALQITRSC